MGLSIAKSLLDNQGFGQGANKLMLDPRYGGQFGYMSDYPTYVNHTPYLQRNLIIKVLAAPAGFSLLPNPEVWIGTLKAIWENQATSVDGLHRKITGDFASTPFGAGGEEQEVLRDAKRERTQLVWNGVEREGMPFSAFFESWFTLFGQDPDTKWPLISTYTQRPTDNLPDTRSACILFFEPNQTLTAIEKAWIVVDVFPKETVDSNGKFDKNSPGDILNISMPFTGIAQSNLAVRRYAQTVLESINFTNANPNLAPAVINDIDSNVSAVAFGYADQVKAAAADALQL